MLAQQRRHDLARLAPRRAGSCPTPERVERHPAGVEQPRHVVVGRDQQRRPGRGTARRRASSSGSTWPCGRDDRQPAHGLVQPAGDRRVRPDRLAAVGPGGADSSGPASFTPVVCHRGRGPRGNATGPSLRPKAESPLTALVTHHTTAASAAQIGGATDGALPTSRSGSSCASSSRAVDLDGRSVCVVVPDGTRSCPLPLLLSAVHGALHGRVDSTDRARRARHPCRDDRGGARRAPRLRARRDRGALPRQRPCATTNGGTRRRSSTLGTIAADRIAELSGGLLRHAVDVRINRAVVEHDVTLIVGPVFPHEVVGFSGGNKYLFPGVSGQEMIDLSHWLGALITSAEIIGTRGITPVRALIDEAAVAGPRRTTRALRGRPARAARTSTPSRSASRQAAWAAAAEVSAETHVRYLDAPVTGCCRSCPSRYDDLWTGAKGFYKVEPVVADGGEVVLYAPHIRQVSTMHPQIAAIGYHCRDYFLAQWDRFADVPLGRPGARHPPAGRRHLRPGHRRDVPGAGHPRHRHPRGRRPRGEPRVPRPGRGRRRRLGGRSPARWSCPTRARCCTGCAPAPRRPPGRRLDRGLPDCRPCVCRQVQGSRSTSPTTARSRVGRDEADWFGPGAPTRPVVVGDPVEVVDDLGPATSVTVVDGDMRCSVRAYPERSMVVFRTDRAHRRRRPGHGRLRPAVGRVAGLHPGGTGRRWRPRRTCGPWPSSTASSACPSNAGADLDGFFLLPHRPPTGWPLLLSAPDGRTLLLAPLDAFHEQTVGPQRRHPALRLARRPRLGARRASPPTWPCSPVTAPGTASTAGAGCSSTGPAPSGPGAGPTRSGRDPRTGPTTGRLLVPHRAGPRRGGLDRRRRRRPAGARRAARCGAARLVVLPARRAAAVRHRRVGRATHRHDRVGGARRRPPRRHHLAARAARQPAAGGPHPAPRVRRAARGGRARLRRRRLRRPGHARGLRAVARPVP